MKWLSKMNVVVQMDKERDAGCWMLAICLKGENGGDNVSNGFSRLEDAG